MRISHALLGLLLVATNVAEAAGSIRTHGMWIRATAPGQSIAAAYGQIENSGAAADRLISASSPEASAVELHVTELVGGVYQMRSGALELAPHATASLAPNGSHLMIMGLKRPLVAGATLVLTLRFAQGGDVRVEVPVRSATAGEP